MRPSAFWKMRRRKRWHAELETRPHTFVRARRGCKMPEFFVQNWWAGLSVWIVLFVSDYMLTLVCARLYQKGVRDKIVFEGSYELTPYFQRDIDALRRVSPRFVWALVAMSVVLFVFW